MKQNSSNATLFVENCLVYLHTWNKVILSRHHSIAVVLCSRNTEHIGHNDHCDRGLPCFDLPITEKTGLSFRTVTVNYQNIKPFCILCESSKAANCPQRNLWCQLRLPNVVFYFFFFFFCGRYVVDFLKRCTHPFIVSVHVCVSLQS